MLDQHDKALVIYKDILKGNETNKQVHLNLITILYEAGDIYKALKHIDSIEDSFEDISDLLYIKVAFYFELEKREEAIEKLYEALEYDWEMSSLLLDLLPAIAEDSEFMKIIEEYSND